MELNEYQSLAQGTAIYEDRSLLLTWKQAGDLYYRTVEEDGEVSISLLQNEINKLLEKYEKSFHLTYAILALCGEAGELANKLKKNLRAGTEPDPGVLGDELGDCQWYVSAVAKELGFPLETIAEMNLDKLAERKAQKRITG